MPNPDEWVRARKENRRRSAWGALQRFPRRSLYFIDALCFAGIKFDERHSQVLRVLRIHRSAVIS